MFETACHAIRCCVIFNREIVRGWGKLPHERTGMGVVSLWSINIPEVMKTGSANLNFLCDFLQLPLSNISLFTVFFTAYVCFFRFFFKLAFWLGICFQVDVEIITPPPPPPCATCRVRPPLCFLSLLTILSLVHKCH